jgi:PAS domain S-box-containing protein
LYNLLRGGDGLSKNQSIVELEYLFQTIEKICKASRIEEITTIIFDYLEGILDYTMAVIYMINHEKNLLEVVDARGPDVSRLKNRVRFRIGEGAVGWIAREKKGICLYDALESEIKVRQFWKEDPIIRSFLGVPMIVEGRVVGIIRVSHSEPGLYDNQDIKLVGMIASQTASIIEKNYLLKDTQRLKDHILDSINSGVIVIDNSQRVISFNRAAESITGYSFSELKDQNLTTYPFKKSETHFAVLETLKTQKVFFEKETYLLSKAGKEIPIVISTSLLYDEQGNIQGATAVFRDITIIKNMEDQIKQSERLALIGSITAGIAHEIRNPLLPIRTAASLLVKKLEDNHSYYELANIILRESENMNSFLTNFVNLAKPPSKKPEKVNINSIINEAADLISHELSSKEISFKISLSLQEAYVLATKGELKQVLLNLLLNSKDAVKNNGLIELQAKVENQMVLITLSDNGDGMDEDTKLRIFDPFFSTKDEGMGLGLSIVQSIIIKYGGSLKVESIPGQGSIFIISLPLMEEDDLIGENIGC